MPNKIHSLRQGRILGVDFGLKRIGIAVSDPTQTIASACQTIIFTSWKQIVSDIQSIVKQFKVVAIVVGLPLNMNGSRSSLCDEVEKFKTKLLKTISVPIMFHDERMTTLAAKRTMKGARQSPTRKKDNLNVVSAVIILQSFLDRQSSNKR